MDITTEFSKKLDKTHDGLLRLEGQVSTLTALVAAYQSQVSKLEGRQWGLLVMSIGAMAGAILSFVMGKH